MRNTTVDIAKGMASVLVVIGHGLAMQQQANALAHLSHIATPLFFFLSGLYLQPGRPLGTTLREKADAWLKPYAVVLLAIGLVPMLQGRADPLRYLAGILYGSGFTIVLIPLWFLPQLFLAHLACNAVLHMTTSRHALALFAAMLLAASPLLLPLFWLTPVPAWLAGTVAAGHDGQWRGLPFSADLLPLSMACLLLGYCCAPRIATFRPHPAAVLAALALLLAGLHDGVLRLDFNMRVWREPWLAAPMAGAGIYLTLAVAYALANSPCRRALVSLGHSTLFILLFHLLFERWVMHGFQHLPAAWTAAYLPVAVPVAIAGSLLCRAVVVRVPWLAALLLTPRARRAFGEGHPA